MTYVTVVSIIVVVVALAYITWVARLSAKSEPRCSSCEKNDE